MPVRLATLALALLGSATVSACQPGLPFPEASFPPAETLPQTEGTYLSVRFGNVLGSRGSVLETFQGQIDSGGPVTVVDPKVTRYFMTVEEAVQLVIQAGAVGRDGEALVLDMGDPVSIEQVARQMIAHSDRDIDIVYTGLRPGEKMHEVLFGPDEVGIAVEHPKISHVIVPPGRCPVFELPLGRSPQQTTTAVDTLRAVCFDSSVVAERAEGAR